MEFLYCGIIGYLIGTVNPSYLIAKLKGFDIRTRGSGNAGASNAMILFGKLLGAACAVFDIAKAYFAILLSELMFLEFRYAFAVTGVACVIGHIFPFYMKFKGGKGLACLGGMVLFFDWRVFLIMLIGAVAIALITDYICFVPITASFAFPFVYGFMKGDLFGPIILSVVAVVMILKHIENLQRIKSGTEMHLSFLWKPNEEMERMKAALGEADETVETHFSGRKI